VPGESRHVPGWNLARQIMSITTNWLSNSVGISVTGDRTMMIVRFSFSCGNGWIRSQYRFHGAQEPIDDSPRRKTPCRPVWKANGSTRSGQ
jgi:hypothetical protein